MSANCSALCDAFNVRADVNAESGKAYTWGEVAALLDVIQKTYGSLEPPPELDYYNLALLPFLRHCPYNIVDSNFPSNTHEMEREVIGIFAGLKTQTGL